MSNKDVDCTGVNGGTTQPTVTPITKFNVPAQQPVQPSTQPAPSGFEIPNPFASANSMVIASAVIAVAAIAGVGILIWKMK